MPKSVQTIGISDWENGFCLVQNTGHVPLIDMEVAHFA
jgi:hypothetical protein